MAACLDYQSVYCKRKSASANLRWHVLAGVLLFGALALRVWVKIQCTSVGYDLAKERQRSVELDMERREFELQRSLLLRPDTLSVMAEKRLGLKMVPAAQLARIAVRR